MLNQLAEPTTLPWTGWFNRDLIEHMPVAVYVCDADGVLVAYNAKAATLWGTAPVLGDSQQKFCGAHRLHLADGTYVPHHLTPLAAILHTRQPTAFEAIVGRPDGTLRNVSANLAPLFNDAGQFIGFVNCVLDITEHKKANESRDRMWRLSPDLMVMLAQDGSIVSANPSWTALLGWTDSDLAGASLGAFVHADDRAHLAAQLRLLAGGAKVAPFELRCLGADGAPRWLSWSAVGDAGHVHAVGRDITEHKEQQAALRAAEDALRQSQKMEAIGQLTGGVAHDFNNLLTVIRGAADVLRLPGIDDSKRLRFINTIADTADRAAKLTHQLLAFSRRQALQPEVFDVVAGVTAIREMLVTLTGGRIVTEFALSDQPCLIDADASQLDTAIVNMVVNARDAMDGAGRITLQVAPVTLIPAIRAHPARAGAFVAVSIADSGKGIGPDHLARIFEPFFTTKPIGEGTGLGLSQVFGFAKQSGGDVLVDSTPGTGTTFTLFLPRFLGALPAPAGAALRELPSIGAGTAVLVVEDNPDVGEFAAEMLHEFGFGVVLVTSGDAALAALAAEPARFQVVFSDIEMPGMNGIELAATVRARHPGLPVLLTSGYSHMLAEQGIAGTELLQKPYTMAQLTTAILRHRHPQ